MKPFICVVTVLIALTWSIAPVRAQPTSTSIPYPTGWNMVGGPPGTDFSAAGALYAYADGEYQLQAQRQSSACAGYWVYFFTPRLVLLPAVSSTTQVCGLQTGWNLIGDPFDDVAQLPPGTNAFWWNPMLGRYDVVSAIPEGGAAWIYSSAAGVITLTSPATTPPPTFQPTLTIAPDSPGSVFSVHVGDTIELLTPYGDAYSVTADSSHLQLLQAGVHGELTCIGEPACEFNFTTRFWIWQATEPGVASITLDPGCLTATPPCAAPSRVFEIDISP